MSRGRNGRSSVGAVVPLSGRYAHQGAQMRAGLELWAGQASIRLLVEDDTSQPAHAARVYGELLDRGCRFVLAPYGGDSTRAVAIAHPGVVVWNHGAAADDVQRRPGVVSVPSPASDYLVALGRAVAALRPGGSVALVTARGPFGQLARQGIEQAAGSLGLTIAASLSFTDPPSAIAATRADAVLLCGALGREITLLRALVPLCPDALLGGVSPGVADFPALLGADPEGLLAPVQWHPEAGATPQLGESSTEIVAASRRAGLEHFDYVAAQAYAAALIASHCLELCPEDPLAAALRLSTSTFFGAFELDAVSGVQRGHCLSVVRWRNGHPELLIAASA